MNLCLSCTHPIFILTSRVPSSKNSIKYCSESSLGGKKRTADLFMNSEKAMEGNGTEAFVVVFVLHTFILT